MSEDWKEKIQAIADSIGTDNEHSMCCVMWCVGTLNLLKCHGILEGGEYEMTEKGDVLYESLRTDFKPTDEEIATVIVAVADGEDAKDIILFLSTYRDHGDSMLEDWKRFSEAYKYN